jgi:RHS repeat-associated protein
VNTGVGLLVEWPSLTPRFERRDESGGTVVTGASPLQADRWWHLVGTFDGSTMRLYVNGLEVGSAASLLSAETRPSAWLGKFDIDSGASQYPGYFYGTIDESAVYPVALSLSQVQDHYVTGRLGYPVPVSPVAGADVTAELVTLETGDLGADASYRYQVTTSLDPGFSAPLVDSGAVAGASVWLVPEGVLAPGQALLWRVRATSAEGLSSAWSSAEAFDYVPPRFGVREYWPVWSRGPLNVNQATGNLILSLPGPTYPRGVGSLSISFAYNAHDGTDRFGLGTGWTMNVSGGTDSPPARLVDRSVLTGGSKLQSVLRVSQDGSADEYARLGTSNTYLAATGDGSRLSRNEDGSFTLADPDGSLYTFGVSNPTTGVALLTSAEQLAAESGRGRVVYTYSTGKIASVSLQDLGGARFGTLTFNWACAGQLVCVTGPDGVQWRFGGETGSTGKLARVNNGMRDIWLVGYSGGLPTSVKNANDLDPTHSNISPGYLSSHALAVGYDANTPARVTSVSDGPFRDRRYGTVGQLTSTWTFAYEIPCSVGRHNPAQSHAFALPAVAGCSTVTPPNQQGVSSPKMSRVLWDARSHPVERVDVFGNYELSAYNARDQLVWSEDEDGNPTDYAYDAVDHTLTSITGPDPDGGGPLPRPLLRYRYDETRIGSETTPGPGLQGLSAAYYSNANFSGRPKVRKTDPNIDFDWPTGPPEVGRDCDYSVRWQGNLVVATEGDYVFSEETTSDTESVRLTIRDTDGSGKLNVKAFEHWHQAPANVVSLPIRLTAGRHPIVFEYKVRCLLAFRMLSGGSLQSQATFGPQLKWRCPGCGLAGDTVIPATAFAPAYLNETSELSPGATVGASTRIAFTHQNAPEKGTPDYSLVQVGGKNLITSYAYDQFARMIEKVMPKGNASRTLDANGNLVGAITLGFTTRWAYYAAGSIATPSCAGGVSANQAGLLRSLTRDGITAITSVYDAAGRPRSVTNAKGTTCRSYDAEGRLTNEQAPLESQATTYAYDPAGQQRTATDASGTLTAEYDEQGSVLRAVDSYGSETESIRDQAGNTLMRRIATGSLSAGPVYTGEWGYDDDDRPSSLTDPAGRAYSFLYDTRSNLRAIQYPNGTFTWTAVNSAGWLTELVNRHGTLGSTLPATPPADANPIADYTYGYYGNGQRKDETRTAGGLLNETWSYAYDELGRLSRVTLPIGVVREYLYDPDSNRTQVQVNGIPVEIYSYDQDLTPGVDQLTSVVRGAETTVFTYTGDGQVETRGLDSLSWDGRGRLSGGTFSGQAVSYGFDASGFRRSRTAAGVTTRYLHGGLLETNSAGVIGLFDVDGPAGDLAHYLGAPGTGTPVSYRYYNAHGDLAAEANQGGSRTASYSYDPFGSLSSGSAGSGTSERYTGRWDKKLDTTSGLIEMGVRPYDPTLGRFLAVDPVEGGSCNPYDYVCQDPTNLYDLDGRDLFDWLRGYRNACQRKAGCEAAVRVLDETVRGARRAARSEPASYAAACGVAGATGAVAGAVSGPGAALTGSANCLIAITTKYLQTREGRVQRVGKALEVLDTVRTLGYAYVRGMKRWYDAWYSPNKRG